ncbi:preprotein translocase subunit SecD [Mycolicibacterium neworleansense]|uniref:Preprotein translocase subunit SecD n=1 Tax=Mycolicibacterium neworleansense TaxID=146018 RepID=A0A0H5RKS4_9MYCO|nr:hypothetical protein [Mycolicibacterium neworleansense]MCV7363927.1 hypothetical protein [Mycolicibacterium neworleansense]CRZ14735.1 preprotein translocase subunit SecD [Mycolicibacterium neworleansense]
MSDPIPFQYPPPQFPPPGHSGTTALTRILGALFLVVPVGGYAAAVFWTGHIWQNREATRMTYSTATSNGSPPPPDALAKTREVVENRLHGMGFSGSEVATDGSTLVVTIPSRDPDAVRDITMPGQLAIRPVVHAMPAKPGSSPAPTSTPAPRATKPDQAQRISDEKQLRQATNPSMQILALQFQATRCGDDDVLAGHDDPNLPLVTCSDDGETVYLLDRSVMSGAEITDADSGYSEDAGRYVVDVAFTGAGTKTWADFTTANIGTQTAFTLDTRVVSAPEIREAITGGRVQITGDFTADSARALAGVLESGSLPFSLSPESSEDATLPPTMLSKLLRGLIIAVGIGVLAITIAGVVYLAWRRPGPAVQMY